jgi:hypothetical protein
VTDSLKLQVFEVGADGANTPTTDARVVLGRRDLIGDSRWPHDDLLQTHGHLSDGFYGTFIGTAGAEPGPGEWLLVVTKPSNSPVVQRLTLGLSGDTIHARPGWGRDAGSLGARALTVSIVNAGPKVRGDAAQHTTVNVVLQVRQEIVAITGHDDHGNTEYLKMAEGRRNVLFNRGVVNAGVISTIFHGNARARLVAVRSASSDPKKRWLELDNLVVNPVSADQGKRRPDETLDHEFTILDFYRHLQSLGKDFPASVIEAGIFSHAWTMGPIIWNTFDKTNLVNQRAVGDADGRQKDWIPTGPTSATPLGPITDGPIMQGFPDLPSAFKKPEGALRIWGCSHMQNVIRGSVIALQQIKAQTPRNQFFVVAPLTTPDKRGSFLANGEQNTTLDHFKRLVGQFVAGVRYARALESDDLRGSLNYPGAASRFLDIHVFGAPPGMGSLYGTRAGEATFFIDDEPRPANPDPTDPRGENFALFKWYRAEFGDFFVVDELHYVDYQKLRQAPLPDPGFRTQRYAMFFDGEQHDDNATNSSVILRLPSGLEIYRRVPNEADPRRTFRRPIAFTLGQISGHLYVIPKHGLVVVERRGPATVVIIAPDATQDCAAFVGADGITLWLKAPPGTQQFAVDPGPLPVVAPTFFAGSQWRDPRNPLPSIVDGVIEAVPLVCFW